MSLMTSLEVMTHVITIVGLPLAIFAFVYEQRKARQNEEEEIFQMLSDGYVDFLKLALQHPDLRLQSTEATSGLSEEQTERMLSMFGILISLFERAYLVVYDEKMPPHKERRWRSWEDFMREWCHRKDFRTALPRLLPGEDPEFAVYITRIAEEEDAALTSASS
ncbi:MAG TPA: hypothetical protein VNS34_19500 [Rhizobiaceae bacterium]|nr:hypothetical protein [Rhizobiaceae bacterium]